VAFARGAFGRKLIAQGGELFKSHESFASVEEGRLIGGRVVRVEVRILYAFGVRPHGGPDASCTVLTNGHDPITLPALEQP
jgi:hypothetical protein